MGQSFDVIRNQLAEDNEYEDETDKILKQHKDSHKKFVDKFRKKLLDNED